MATELRRALYEPSEPPLRALPTDVTSLLLALPTPPRLAAHLRAVLHLDDALSRIAEDADARLAFQAGYPVRAG